MEKTWKAHKWKIIIGMLLVILIITNPSVSNFKEFTNNDNSKRTGYYLVFSTFEEEKAIVGYNYEVEGYYTKKYIGFFNNFIEID